MALNFAGAMPQLDQRCPGKAGSTCYIRLEMQVTKAVIKSKDIKDRGVATPSTNSSKNSM